jgi:hypothetical protein
VKDSANAFGVVGKMRQAQAGEAGILGESTICPLKHYCGELLPTILIE